MNIISFQNRAIAISSAALALTICCLCGNKVVLSNQYGLGKIDIYNLDSLITLLNKNVKKIKVDPVLGVTSYDSVYTLNGIKIRKVVLQTKKSENIISLDIKSDTIHRVTVFSDKVKSKSKPEVGQIFSKVSSSVLPYLPVTIEGSVGLLYSDDDRIVYHFEFLQDAASINKANMESMLQNSRIIKIVIAEPVMVYNEWHAEMD